MESRVPAFGRRMKNASNVKQGERERQILISRVYRVALVKPKKRDNSDRGAAKADKFHGT